MLCYIKRKIQTPTPTNHMFSSLKLEVTFQQSYLFSRGIFHRFRSRMSSLFRITPLFQLFHRRRNFKIPFIFSFRNSSDRFKRRNWLTCSVNKLWFRNYVNLCNYVIMKLCKFYVIFLLPMDTAVLKCVKFPKN